VSGSKSRWTAKQPNTNNLAQLFVMDGENKHYNEKEAIRLLVSGNLEGFQAIYKRYASAVERVGFKFFRSTESAEDLLQEVFTAVWINREKFALVESLEPYLITMCTNKAKSNLKAFARRKLRESEYANNKHYVENSVEDHLLGEECRALLEKAVERFPATQKRVYELVTNEGATHKEVAAQLNCTEKTVKNLMTLSLQSVKGSLGELIVVLVSFSAI
jgi:RNA polymerase sigma-70 factor (ECF subfamily)